ncbi:hypothetical protein X751_08400 [Mesorhizobium sp. LNJC395A00]|nr:hypothetical protein X751_08400 [Mesorhizobium sp. LNJC395A00]
MIMDQKRKPHRFPQSTLLEAALVSNVTFNAWRKRNGLFPWTNADRKWNTYSGAEITTARTVVVLTSAGMAASRAVSAAMALLPMYRAAWETGSPLMESDPVLALSFDQEGQGWSDFDASSPVGEVIRREQYPVSIILRPARIVLEVLIGIEKVMGLPVKDLLQAVNPKPHESFGKRGG